MEGIKKKVSIVIPCRDEEKYIGKCIESIVDQSYGIENIEIFVCDGLSSDGTQSIVRNYGQKYGQVRLLLNPKKIAPAAMNLGIENSTGDIIIIFGAHAFMDKEYVAKCVEKLRDGDICCVGGRIINISENDKAEAISMAMSSPFGVGNALFRYSESEELVDTVAFGAYKREVFGRVGMFDEEFVRNQDDEFNFRVTESGGKILLCPDIVSYYYTRGSFGKLWRQYYQYGFWKVRVIQKHRRPASLRHLVPMLFVLSLILGAALGFFSGIFRELLGILILSYLIFSLLFSYKAAKGNHRYIFGVVLCYMILHLSYGFGFIEGIFVFYISRNKRKIRENTKTSR